MNIQTSVFEKKAEKISNKCSVKELLLDRFKSAKKDGFVWYELFQDDFNRHSFDQAVSELVKEQKITKIINGLFYVKRKYPSMESIANAIMDKNNFNGVTANENNIWLATIPKTKKYSIQGQILTFKATSSKKLQIPKKIGKEAYFYLRLGDDECYSPPESVQIIIPYVKMLADKLGRKVIVWCCADTEESNYVKILSALPYCEVIHTHIFDGFNFLTDVPDFEFDCIITNPPYKGKRLWVEKCMSYGKPFGLLLPGTWINDTAVNKIFNNDMQMLIPDKRTQFIRNTTNDKASAATFKAVYYCWHLLDEKLVQVNL